MKEWRNCQRLGRGRRRVKRDKHRLNVFSIVHLQQKVTLQQTVEHLRIQSWGLALFASLLIRQNGSPVLLKTQTLGCSGFQPDKINWEERNSWKVWYNSRWKTLVQFNNSTFAKELKQSIRASNYSQARSVFFLNTQPSGCSEERCEKPFRENHFCGSDRPAMALHWSCAQNTWGLNTPGCHTYQKLLFFLYNSTVKGRQRSVDTFTWIHQHKNRYFDASWNSSGHYRLLYTRYKFLHSLVPECTLRGGDVWLVIRFRKEGIDEPARTMIGSCNYNSRL